MKRQLYPLLLVTFIGSFGLSVVLPFLVFLVNDFGGNPFIYGLMGATYPAFQLIGGPLLGRWSDKFGRKKILLVSQAGTLLSWVIFLLCLYLPVESIRVIESDLLGNFTVTWPLIVVFIARALDGLTGGNISVANAYLADISTNETRKSNFGKMSAASSLGFILGPAIAGSLAAVSAGYSLPVIFALAISIVGLIIIIMWLPESKHTSTSEEEEQRSFKNILKIKHVKYMFALYFLIFLGFNFFYTAFPVHASSTLAWKPAQLGLYFSVLSVFMVLVQGPLLTKIGKRFSDYSLVIFGSLILSFQFFLLIPALDSLAYVSLLFFALGNGLMWPSYLSILSACGSKNQQGSIQGLGTSFGSLASIIGLLAGGFLYNSIGSYTFLIAGLIIFAVFILSFRSRKIQKQ